MKLFFVVAVSDNNVIGVENLEMPWHLPDDLRFFKQKTLGKPIIMGKDTFISFGQPLKGRENIVLSRTLKEAPEGTVLFSSMEDALKYLKGKNTPEAAIIGGGKVFKDSWHLVDEVFMTRIHMTAEGGQAFIDFPNPDEWKLVWEEKHEKDDRHIYEFTFQQWLRK